MIFVLEGRVSLEYGTGGRETLEAGAGDTLYVAPGEVHREGNPGDERSLIVVVRGGEGDLVVNESGPASG